MEPTSRIAQARRRAAAAKRALAAAAAAGFVAAAVLAYASHPGTAANRSAGSDSVSTAGGDSSEGDSFGFGSGSIEPSDGAVPQVQSHVS